MIIQGKLKLCQNTREKAAESCLGALETVFNSSKKIYEIEFKDLWLNELSKYSNIEKDGWYDHPPSGIAVLFSDGSNLDRVNYSNLRPEKYWPRDDIYFDPKGLGYLFASPYSIINNIPIIGDFGFTYYLGKTQKIKNHFKKCFEVLDRLIDNIKIGLIFKELYAISAEIIARNNLKNHIVGTTDKAITDFGHTIPFIDRDPNSTEQSDINSGDLEKIHKVISQARIFSSSVENYAISENCAFTFEPRFISSTDSSLPMFSFHTIIQFVAGKKIVLSNMDKIIKILKMEWIYE